MQHGQEAYEVREGCIWGRLEVASDGQSRDMGLAQGCRVVAGAQKE